jgi:hypothetical protein
MGGLGGPSVPNRGYRPNGSLNQHAVARRACIEALRNSKFTGVLKTNEVLQFLNELRPLCFSRIRKRYVTKS